MFPKWLIFSPNLFWFFPKVTNKLRHVSEYKKLSLRRYAGHFFSTNSEKQTIPTVFWKTAIFLSKNCTFLLILEHCVMWWHMVVYLNYLFSSNSAEKASIKYKEELCFAIAIVLFVANLFWANEVKPSRLDPTIVLHTVLQILHIYYVTFFGGGM